MIKEEVKGQDDLKFIAENLTETIHPDQKK